MTPKSLSVTSHREHPRSGPTSDAVTGPGMEMRREKNDKCDLGDYPRVHPYP